MAEIRHFSDFNAEHKDVLQELGNIGSGNALTSLSQMIEANIQMGIPKVKVINGETLNTLINGTGSLYVGVVLTVKGDLDCVIAFLLNEDFTQMMLEKLTGTVIKDIDELDQMAKSAICEIGNVMCNSYINAIAAMTGTEMNCSVPYMYVDSADRILDIFVKRYLDEDKEMIFVENRFYQEDRDMESYVLFHPELETLKDLLKRLGT